MTRKSQASQSSNVQPTRKAQTVQADSVQLLTREQVDAIIAKDGQSASGDQAASEQISLQTSALAKTAADALERLNKAQGDLADAQTEVSSLKGELKSLQEQLEGVQQQVKSLTEANEALIQEKADVQATLEAEKKVKAVTTRFMSLREKAAELRRDDGITPDKFKAFFGETDEEANALIILHVKGTAEASLDNIEFFIQNSTPKSIYPTVKREDVTVFSRPGDEQPASREDGAATKALDFVLEQNFGKEAVTH